MNNHIILSCHEDDYATMATLLAGMEVHSDFVTADMNELWRPEKYDDLQSLAVVTEEHGPKPKRDAWHGFTYPDFPWKTLLSLLESASWKHVNRLCFLVMQETEVLIFTLTSFSKAIVHGFVK